MILCVLLLSDVFPGGERSDLFKSQGDGRRMREVE